MIYLNAITYDELQNEFKEKEYEISTEIVTNICDALDNNVNVVRLGLFTKLDLDLQLNKNGFLHALELNLPRVIETENYELCKRAQDYILKLKK